MNHRIWFYGLIILFSVNVFVAVAYLDKKNTTGGIYLVSTKDIVLFSRGDSLLLRSDALHEIGHYVWYNELSENDRKEYAQIFGDANKFVSDYATTGVGEDFAEEYSSRIVCVSVRKSLREDRDNFFNGKGKLSIVLWFK